jgi:hypothetical protein
MKSIVKIVIENGSSSAATLIKLIEACIKLMKKI